MVTARASCSPKKAAMPDDEIGLLIDNSHGVPAALQGRSENSFAGFLHFLIVLEEVQRRSSIKMFCIPPLQAPTLLTRPSSVTNGSNKSFGNSLNNPF
jgi:hypothetical protein